MRKILNELAGLEAPQLHERTGRVGRRQAATDWEMAACLLAGERSGLHLAHNFGTMVRYAVEAHSQEAQKASELLRAARVLEGLELISAAFRTGALNWSKIRELTRIVTPETEQEWLDFALVNTAEQIRQEMSQSPRDLRKDSKAARKPNAGVTENLFNSPTESRPGEEGVTDVGRADDTRVGEPGPVSSRGSACHDSTKGASPGRDSGSGASRGGGSRASAGEASAAEASADAASPGAIPQAASPIPDGNQTTSPRPPATGKKLVRVTHYLSPEQYAVYEQGMNRVRTSLRKSRVRQEEVLAEAFRQILAMTPTRKRLRHQVVLHVDLGTQEAWFDTSRGLLKASEEDVGRALSDGQIAVLADNPAPSLADAPTPSASGGAAAGAAPPEADASEPLAEQLLLLKPGTSRGKSRPRTAIPHATFRALFVRARGRCETRGCGQGGFLQVHHRRPWSEGGTNSLEDLELRCSGCHALAHREDYQKKPEWRQARDNRRRKTAKRGANTS